jgi:hypothetical protein
MQHKTIPDAELHEVKGAASATTGQILEAQGDGTAEFVTRFLKVQAALTPSLVGAHTTVSQAFSVSGVLSASDTVVQVVKPTDQAGLSIGNVRVTANNQITLQFVNSTNSAITPTAAETYSFIIHRA